MSGNKTFICSICQLPSTGWPCNADPVNDGVCCETCDNNIVLRARINRIVVEERRAAHVAESPKE